MHIKEHIQCVYSLRNNKMNTKVPTIFEVIGLFNFRQSGEHEIEAKFAIH